MDRKTQFARWIGWSILPLSLTLLLPWKAISQDTTKVTAEKEIRIVTRVIDDKKGTKQEFDTTLTLNHRMRPGEIRNIMKRFMIQSDDTDDVLKEIEIDLGDLDFPDSGRLDTLCRFAQRFRWDGKRMGPLMNWNRGGSPGKERDFGFFIPSCPRFPDPLRYRDRGENLNDLLGDIPLDNVTKYTIKDTKGGKKITIRMKNDPFLHRHGRMIQYREPREMKRFRYGMRPGAGKRIVIDLEDERGEKL